MKSMLLIQEYATSRRTQMLNCCFQPVSGWISNLWRGFAPTGRSWLCSLASTTSDCNTSLSILSLSYPGKSSLLSSSFFNQSVTRRPYKHRIFASLWSSYDRLFMDTLLKSWFFARKSRNELLGSTSLFTISLFLLSSLVSVPSSRWLKSFRLFALSLICLANSLLFFAYSTLQILPFNWSR